MFVFLYVSNKRQAVETDRTQGLSGTSPSRRTPGKAFGCSELQKAVSKIFVIQQFLDINKKC